MFTNRVIKFAEKIKNKYANTNIDQTIETTNENGEVVNLPILEFENQRPLRYVSRETLLEVVTSLEPRYGIQEAYIRLRIGDSEKYIIIRCEQKMTGFGRSSRIKWFPVYPLDVREE